MLFRKLLSFVLLVISVTCSGQSKGLFRYDPSALFDQLNLQSDNVANYTLSGASVTQWNDLSPVGRNATQATPANKPTYNSTTGVLFDGSNDFLSLGSEMSLNVFSLYILYKYPTASTTTGIIIAGTSVNDYLQFVATQGFSFQKASSGGASGYIGGEGDYQVLSIRVNGTSGTVVKIDDRTSMGIANTLSAPGYHLGQLGRFNSGQNFAGYVKAVMVSSQYLDDATDNLVRQYLYYKYSTYSKVGNVTALGDSNTLGHLTTGTYVQGWLYQLAVYLNQSEVNLGISGTALQTGTVDNGIDRYQAQLVTRPYKDKVIIMYSNNTYLTGSSLTYGPTLSTLVADLLSRGYLPKNICLSSPVYRRGNDGATELDNTRAVIITVKNTYGTQYADVLQAMRDNGGDALMADLNHFNAPTGTTLVYNTIKNQCFSN